MRKRFFGLLIALAFALPFVTAAPCFADTGRTTINQITYEYDTETNEATVVGAESNISGNVVIPETITVDEREYTVTLIGQYAFLNHVNLTAITIPESVTSIGYCAFNLCTSLTEVTIPESVSSIGNAAFEHCSELTEVTIPEKVTSIGGNTFGDCSKLTQITIPEGVKSIELSAFWNCRSLTNVYVEKNLSLGNTLFEDAPQDIHIWRYEVVAKSTEEPDDGKTHVAIVSVKNKDNTDVANPLKIADGAMGNGYVIDEVKPDNLSLKHALTKTEETPATCENPGNIECWKCSVCGKYFKDEGGTEPITSEDVEIPALGHSYENGECTVCGAIDPDFKAVITAGANGTWQKGAKDGLSFTSNAAFADFQKVCVDGKDLDASSYTLVEGSTIVTLQPSYLDTLPVGKHTLAIVSETGTAETEFTVAAAEEQGVPEGQVIDNEVVNSGDKESLPKTGDDSVLPIAVLSILVIVSIVAGVLALRRSRI